MAVPSALHTPWNHVNFQVEAKYCQQKTYLAVWREAISMGRAVLAVGLSGVASSLANFEDRWVLGESRDSHGAHKAEGDGSKGRELHFEKLRMPRFGIFGRVRRGG